jgi:hypothetical protein
MGSYVIEVLFSEKRIYHVEAKSVDEVIRKYDADNAPLKPDTATQVFEPDIDLVCINDPTTGETLWVNDALASESLLANEDTVEG